MTKIPLGCSGQIAAMGKWGAGERFCSAQRKPESPFLFLSSRLSQKQELSSLRERRRLGVSRLPASPLRQPCSAVHAQLRRHWGARASAASVLARRRLVPSENRPHSLRLFCRRLGEAFRIRGLNKGCDER